MPVININLFSMTLRHSMDCTVILPEKYDMSKKLKCVWLYHGGSGNDKQWLYHSSIVDEVESRKFAAVLPNVQESCFVNMNIGEAYGTYVGKELPKTIWNMFSCISKSRENNYIAGYSNGGYGCLQVGLTYPQSFSKLGAFSAGDKADSDFINDGSSKSNTRIYVFGADDLHQTNYSFLHLANILIDQNVDKPEIFHACGGKDPWLKQNRIVRDYFQSHREYQYYYEEIESLGHEWKFWNYELKHFLDYCGLVELSTNL